MNDAEKVYRFEKAISTMIQEQSEIRQKLNAAERELEKWRNYLPDDDELRACAKQAKSKSGIYTDGLAAQYVYIVALEAVLQEKDTKLKIARAFISRVANDVPDICHLGTSIVLRDEARRALDELDGISQRDDKSLTS
jgi:hypothetical protein